MQEILKSVYSVLCRYELYFGTEGVTANLNSWSHNKQPLIELLRKHPAWNEKELAIVFPDIQEYRDLEEQSIREHCRRLTDLGRTLPNTEFDAYQRAMHTAAVQYSFEPTEYYINVIKEQASIRCAVGQKTSRIVGRICQKFGIDQHPEYNVLFARLSDALNPIVEQKTGVLSVHPCDYLEMSRGNSWNSCHRIGGEYQAGTLSYMNDEVTMIFYTVDTAENPPYWKSLKRNRQVFCYKDGLLMQSRLYPNNDNQTAREEYRRLVSCAMAVCESAQGEWEAPDYYTGIDRIWTQTGSRQYRDYVEREYVNFLSHPNVRSAQTVEDMQLVPVGNPAYCLVCGETLSDSGDLDCGDGDDECERIVVCQDCGKNTPREETVKYGDLYYCPSCIGICQHCHRPTREALVAVYDQYGHPVMVCPDCHSKLTAVCDTCSVAAVCTQTGGAVYCGRSAAAA